MIVTNTGDVIIKCMENLQRKYPPAKTKRQHEYSSPLSAEGWPWGYIL